MGMFTTENQDALADALRSFSKVSAELYSPAYEAGFLQSTLIQVLKDLPKREQKALIKDFNAVTERLQKKLLDKSTV